MFEPPHCPNRSCSFHVDPPLRFYRRFGTFRPNWSDSPIPRLRCKQCGRTFSQQTFSLSRYDRRPDVNAELCARLAAGCGFRQCARELGLSASAVQAKFRKIARGTAAVVPGSMVLARSGGGVG